MSDTGHGFVSSHALPFTNLLPLRSAGYDVHKLAALAQLMISPVDKLSDGPDAEENLFVPAGYTYFGQFIDHDLTFDNTSRLNPEDFSDLNNPHNEPTNLRTPRFDLDCLYGNGPGDQPYMYAMEDDLTKDVFKNATMLRGGVQGELPWDLLRAGNGRALIGDKRNDENSIVNQIQQIFISYHNKVVAWMAGKNPGLREDDLFEAAKQEVQWTYQKIIIDDFLPRIIDNSVLDFFKDQRASLGEEAYQLFKNVNGKRANLPREFVAAAYRYGHSGVRPGYRMNANLRISIFVADGLPGKPDSLLGFDPLLESHQIDDWGRFFSLASMPGGKQDANLGTTVEDPDVDPALRLQYAYKLDPSLVDPLSALPATVASRSTVQPPSLQLPPTSPNPNGQPSLALLNLLRANRYLIAGGQAFAAKLASIGAVPLDPKYLCVRRGQDVDVVDASGKAVTDANGDVKQSKLYWFETIDNELLIDTPLWFYILAEAQKPVVDLWLYKGGGKDLAKDSPSTFLTADDLLGKTPPSDPANGIKAGQGAATRLGAVGGQIVAEVFFGLLDADSDSIVRAHPGGNWEPSWAGMSLDSSTPATMAKLIKAAGLNIGL